MKPFVVQTEHDNENDDNGKETTDGYELRIEQVDDTDCDNLFASPITLVAPEALADISLQDALNALCPADHFVQPIKKADGIIDKKWTPEEDRFVAKRLAEAAQLGQGRMWKVIGEELNRTASSVRNRHRRKELLSKIAKTNA